MRAATEYRYEKLTWPEINDAIELGKVCIIPCGAVEQHGPHLPLDVDIVCPTSIAIGAAREIPDKTLVLPTVCYGYTGHVMDFPGTINNHYEHFIHHVLDITKSLAYHGFKKIVLLNGHGSNMPNLDLVARRTNLETDAECVLAAWWGLLTVDKDFLPRWRQSKFPGGCSHACELETSLYLYLDGGNVRKDLIKSGTISINDENNPFNWMDLFAAGPATLVSWTSSYSESGVLGDAELASAEKGREAYEEAVKQLIRFITYFKDRPPDPPPLAAPQTSNHADAMGPTITAVKAGRLNAKATTVRHRVLLVFCSLAFLTYLDRICIMRVQGDLERDLKLGQLTHRDEVMLRGSGLAGNAEARAKVSHDLATRRMSWIFAAFVFGYVLFEIPGGWLGDILGPRKVLFRIVIWWSLFTALTGLVSPIMTWIKVDQGVFWRLGAMLAVRFLFGAGEAGTYPNIARALAGWFPFSARGSAQAAIWFASRLGGAFAPLIIGGLIALSGHWTRAFWILGIVGCVWAIGFFVWFRDTPEEKQGVNAAEMDLIRAGNHGAGEANVDPPAKRRVPWRGLVSLNLLLLYGVAFTASFSWFFYVTFLPRYLKEQFNVDYSDSQLVTGLPLLIGAFSCLAGGQISDRLIRRFRSHRWGRSTPGLIGMGAASLCTFSVSWMHSPWAVVVAICVAAAFQILGLPPMWSTAVDIGGPFAGTVGGCMNACGAIGGMLSPLAAAQLATRFGWNVIFVMFGVSYALGALAWTKVDASRRLI